MISEVVNALLITYIATEYSSDDDRQQTSSWWKSRFTFGAIVVTITINILDRVTGAAELAKVLVDDLLHLPKVVFAAILYVITLYVDCKRIQPDLKFCGGIFLPKVGWAFCRIAPLYPFLAVLISFGFLFIISIWEALHLPMSWLNSPIYYGTLYGPFSVCYFMVKRQIQAERESLPTTFGGGGGPYEFEREYKSNDSRRQVMLEAALKRNPMNGF